MWKFIWSSFSIGVKFLIYDLMDEIKPVVAEKKEFNIEMFQNWEHFSESWYYEDYDARHKTAIFSWSPLIYLQASDWDLDDLIELCIFGGKVLQHKGNSILITLFGLPSTWGYQNHMFYWKYFRSKFFWPQRN